MMVVKIHENAVDMRACAIDDRDMSRVHASSSLQMHNLLFALSHRLQVVSKLLVHNVQDPQFCEKNGGLQV